MTANEAKILSAAQIRAAEIGFAALVMWNGAYMAALREGQSIEASVKEANEVLAQDEWRIHHDRWMKEGAWLQDVG